MFRSRCNSCDGIYDSLDVRFTKACDNACSFCIEREGLCSLGKTNVPAMIEATKSSGIRSVLILGGEPFLQPDKLLEYVRGIRLFVDTIYITTSLPAVFKYNIGACLTILDYIDGLNVSVHSVDSDINNDIFVAYSRHNRLECLRQLNCSYSHKIRTSINLVRGGIDNEHRLIEALDYLSSIGCKHIKINELQSTLDLYVSYEKVMGVKLPPPFATGCQTFLPDYAGMRIQLKRSCFMVEDSLKASCRDLFKAVLRGKPNNRFAVLYEDGHISSHWERQCNA